MKQLAKSVIYKAMPESRKLRYLTSYQGFEDGPPIGRGRTQCFPIEWLCMSSLTKSNWGTAQLITVSLGFTRGKVLCTGQS
jgi:hypothetical protein